MMRIQWTITRTYASYSPDDLAGDDVSSQHKDFHICEREKYYFTVAQQV